MEQARQSDEKVVRADSSRPIYFGWVIVAVCCLVMTLLAPLLASFSIFYVAILEELHWSRADTALALSVYFSVSGLASPFAGRLIDRFGPRIVMPAGALVTACAFFWISRMTSLWHFYVAFGIIAAIGATMLNVVPMTTIISNWFVRRRGLAIGLVIAGQGLGQVGIPLIQYLIDHIGWRNSYLVIGGVILVIPTTLILLFLYNRPEDRGLTVEDEAGPLRKRNSEDVLVEEGKPPTHENATKRRSEVVIVDKKWAETEWTIGKSIRTLRFWAFTLGMALLSAGFVMISVQLVAYLKDKGYSSTLAASAVGFEGLINIGGKFFGGALSDRIGREKTVTLGVLLLLTCLLLLIASGAVLSPVLVYAFATCYGMGFGMTLPALMAAGADLFQGKNLGAILGVAWFGGYLGGALGAWLSGYFVDVTRGYTLNFVVIGTVMVVSLALFWKARPSQVRVVRFVPAA